MWYNFYMNKYDETLRFGFRYLVWYVERDTFIDSYMWKFLNFVLFYFLYLLLIFAVDQ